MKRVFCILVSAILGLASLSAEEESSWSGLINFGLSPSFLKESVKVTQLNSVDINQEFKGNGFDVTAGFVAIHNSSGFALKGDLGLGGVTVKDIIETGKSNTGFDFNGRIGLGFAPIRNEKYTLAFCGNLGFDFNLFTDNTTYEGTEFLCTVSSGVFYLGGEIYGNIKLGKSIGLFAAFAYEIPMAGSATCKAEAEVNGITISVSEDYDIHSGGYIIWPTIGLSAKL